METTYYRNSDHSKLWMLRPGQRALEIFITKTNKGIYSRINEFEVSESDIRFIELTNESIHKDLFFSIVDEVFGFYQSIFNQSM